MCVSNPAASSYSTRYCLPLLLHRSFRYPQHTHIYPSYHLLRGLLFRPKPVHTAHNVEGRIKPCFAGYVKDARDEGKGLAGESIWYGKGAGRKLVSAEVAGRRGEEGSVCVCVLVCVLNDASMRSQVAICHLSIDHFPHELAKAKCAKGTSGTRCASPTMRRLRRGR